MALLAIARRDVISTKMYAGTSGACHCLLIIQIKGFHVMKQLLCYIGKTRKNASVWGRFALHVAASLTMNRRDVMCIEISVLYFRNAQLF